MRVSTTALSVVVSVSVSLAVVSSFSVWTSSSFSANVNAFSFAPLPLSTTSISTKSATKSQSRRRQSFSSSPSALFLADEIKEYRKGLSQIHKNPSDVNTNGSSSGSSGSRVVDCVFKFGGSSLANAERIDHVAHLIKDQIALYNYRPRAVVCSAMGKTTNNLLSAGEFALGEFLLCSVLSADIDIDT